MRSVLSWDIFCRVVDNYGDIGVCWRLARQLRAEHSAAVRLWVDDLARWQALHPEGDLDADVQSAEGVEVRRWAGSCAGVVPADVAVDGFGCGLPDDYATAMAQRQPRSLWITLEYLSAEDWVPRHHGLPSPHPRLNIERYFFFPGFVPGTGGLLRESDLVVQRIAFRATGAERFWSEYGYPPTPAAACVVSLFAYPVAPLGQLLDAMSQGSVPIIAAIPQGPLAEPLQAFLGEPGLTGHAYRRGALEIRLLPFLPQPRYDELLWSCDINFVRGEDSFVRAQWAERPALWHVYPQSEGAHGRKLEAYLKLYCAGLAPSSEAAVHDLSNGWNRIADAGVHIGAAWTRFLAHREALASHAQAWAARLAGQPDLAGQLAKFCTDRLK